MVTEAQNNLETVIFDYVGALRECDEEAVRAVLDPNVTRQGLHEEWVCQGPGEVIDTLQEGLRHRRDVAPLEFVRAGSRMVTGSVVLRSTRSVASHSEARSSMSLP